MRNTEPRQSTWRNDTVVRYFSEKHRAREESFIKIENLSTTISQLFASLWDSPLDSLY